jgi:hypothetical protein
MTITERAAIVLQQINAALALVKDAETWRVVANDDWTNVETPDRIVCHEVSRHDAAFIAASRTLLPASLRCLKTAIDGLLEILRTQAGFATQPHKDSLSALTALCDQWEAGR